ncbi:hypothetical protein JCM10914A_17810 [Paenibacillus sp. JCM 10914]|uniref:MerR family transcriptional regulator n=1 Tax=Paenibacillus sp. JCM 10914 TaxID=1236974 RepID=UPI0003CC59BD|nr:MerR family transcriptional regulator [Paenibacillus sp. JCM 10914]GAE06357.1 transcriptional regulator, MerR family [Paenibacillus sp. JCM 10914]
MMRISAFAKISGISIKTLRYYNELGLLIPAHVDEQSGYRYYSEEQLLTVKRIAAFKDQGFTLEQLKPFFDDHIETNDVKNKLIDKMDELQQAMLSIQQQMDEVNGSMKRLEQRRVEHLAHQITIRKVPSQRIASIRDQVHRSELCLLLDEITQYINAHGEHDTHQMTILWHDHDNWNGAHSDLVDIEVAIPITISIPASERVHVGFLPELKSAASLVHHCNPYENDCPAASELRTCLSSQHLTPSNRAPVRETYLTADKDIYGKTRLAELIIPLEE